jgi:shikimate dehydrogenase
MRQPVLVGLIGSNIQQSLSPALFEDACAAVGRRGHYHLMDLDTLPGRTLGDLVQAACTAGFAGFNVTFPCKEEVLPLLDELSDEARQIGAVNTVTIGDNGRTMGFNTDRVGFQRSLTAVFGPKAVKGTAVLLIGAGGAGRAVAFALLDLGVEQLLIHDAIVDRARGLAELLTSLYGHGRARLEEDARSGIRHVAGVVNATPVGMVGHPGIPIPVEDVRQDQWVADVIYTPLETEMIKKASAKACRVMGGAGMCVHQAAEAFRLFTKHSCDIERMQRTFAAAAARREAHLLAPTGEER